MGWLKRTVVIAMLFCALLRPTGAQSLAIPGGKVDPNILTGPLSVRDKSQEPLVGKTVAPFELAGIDGKTYRLENLKGKVLLLSLFATYCSPCVTEMTHLIEFHHKYADKGLAILVISRDKEKDLDLVRLLARRKKLPFPVLLDLKKEATNQFTIEKGAVLLPTTILVGREGKIACITRGFDVEKLKVLEGAITQHLGIITKSVQSEMDTKKSSRLLGISMPRDSSMPGGRSILGKAGYIDETGKIVIPPKFDSAGPFSEGLAPVKIGNKSWYIDETGKMVFDTSRFFGAGCFEEGLAMVTIGGFAKADPKGRFGFIDKTGKLVIEPRFAYFWSGRWSEGLFVVSEDYDPLGTKGYIGRSGEYVIKPQFFDAYDFHDGLAIVQDLKGKRGMVDKSGKYVIPPKFERLGWFHEGLAAAKLDFLFGYIDKTGEFVIKPQFDSAFPFSEGLAPVEVGVKRGFIDKTGKIVIKPRFESSGSFRDGEVWVKIGRKWGAIDKQGNWVVKPRFPRAPRFSEGLAAMPSGKSYKVPMISGGRQVGVQSSGPESKCGYIDKTGKWVIRPRFKAAGRFSNGLARVSIGYMLNIDTRKPIWGYYTYIDKTGKVLWAPKKHIDKTGKISWSAE